MMLRCHVLYSNATHQYLGDHAVVTQYLVDSFLSLWRIHHSDRTKPSRIPLPPWRRQTFRSGVGWEIIQSFFSDNPIMPIVWFIRIGWLCFQYVEGALCNIHSPMNLHPIFIQLSSNLLLILSILIHSLCVCCSLWCVTGFEKSFNPARVNSMTLIRYIQMITILVPMIWWRRTIVSTLHSVFIWSSTIFITNLRWVWNWGWYVVSLLLKVLVVRCGMRGLVGRVDSYEIFGVHRDRSHRNETGMRRGRVWSMHCHALALWHKQTLHCVRLTPHQFCAPY